MQLPTRLRVPCKWMGVERLAFCVWMLTLPLGALATEDQRSELGYDHAQELLAKKNWSEAAAILAQILKTTRGVPELSMDYAKALFYMGKRTEAVEALRLAAQQNKGKIRANFLQKARLFAVQFRTNPTFQTYQDGVNVLSLRKYAEASSRFEKALQAEPDHLEIQVRLGQSRMLEGNFDSAKQNLRSALKLDPMASYVRMWLGRTLHLDGRFAEALVELKQARQELPDSELSLIWLSDTLYASGQKAEALQLLEKDSKTWPQHFNSLLMYLRLQFQIAGDDLEVLKSLNRKLQGLPAKLEKMGSDLLGFDPRNGQVLKSEAEELLVNVDLMISKKAEAKNL